MHAPARDSLIRIDRTLLANFLFAIIIAAPPARAQIATRPLVPVVIDTNDPNATLFRVDVDHQFGAYVQDRWTVNRLTVNAGLRLDWFKNHFPQQSVGPAPLAPARNHPPAQRIGRCRRPNARPAGGRATLPSGGPRGTWLTLPCATLR